MTLQGMYALNGNRAGFWVQHRSWRNMCAQVLSVAGLRIGKLPGDAPVGSPAEVVIHAFDVRSGRPVQLGPGVEMPQDRNYRMIAEPGWYRGNAEPEPAANQS
jgi:hypothetical protein